MQKPSSTPEYDPEIEPVYDPAEVAEKIRSGEYFREAEKAYHYLYHDPMSERYMFLGISIFSLLISLLALIAVNLLYPLNQDVPFIYNADDITNEAPSIRLIGHTKEDPNLRMKRFLVESYVRQREEYNIDMLERSASVVRSQSTDEVFVEYQRLLNPNNPESPITKYQRQATRTVDILSSRLVAADQMEVTFDAYVNSPAGLKKTLMRANITFRFDDIEVNQSTGETTPMVFVVMAYQTRPLQQS